MTVHEHDSPAVAAEARALHGAVGTGEQRAASAAIRIDDTQERSTPNQHFAAVVADAEEVSVGGSVSIDLEQAAAVGVNDPEFGCLDREGGAIPAPADHGDVVGIVRRG